MAAAALNLASPSLAGDAANASIANNGAPVSTDSSKTVKAAAKAFNILASDTDPSNDRLELVSATASFGAVAFTSEGLIAYSQEPGSERDDVIVYTVADRRGGRSSGRFHIKAK